MTAGVSPSQSDLFQSAVGLVADRVGADSIWTLLHAEGHRLFPDVMFADLFSERGRRSVAPQVVATVMVLQKLFGKSDREAVEAFEFDTRWKYGCGVDLDFGGFAHTVLVDMRARLAGSDQPRRIFEVTLDAARTAGMVGHRRVLDSTPLYDAVATMDTITLIRSAIRQLLATAVADGDDGVLASVLRGVLTSGDDYTSNSKPVVDWDDRAARDALIDTRARDGHACLVVLDGRILADSQRRWGVVGTVLGQDLVQDDHGVFRIARRVAKKPGHFHR